MATVGVRIAVGGETFDIDLYSVTAVEWRTVKRHTGMKAGEFMRSLLGDFDADVIAGLVWIGRSRAHPGAAWDDNLPVLELLNSLEMVEDDDGEDEDPKASDAMPPDSSKPDGGDSTSGPTGTSGS